VFFLTVARTIVKVLSGSIAGNYLAAGAERRVSWSLATLNSHEASFTMARQNTALPWDAELVKYEMEEKNKIFHFNSADPVLDDLLHESQIKARQCLIQGPVPEKRYTLLPTRQPDEPLGSFMILPAIKRGKSTRFRL